MKNNKLMFGAAALMLSAGLVGCGQKEVTYGPVEVLPVSYSNVATTTDIEKFESQVTWEHGNYDGKLDDGMVVSVWHKMKINGVDVPVYTARCGYSVHSFAYVDIKYETNFALDVEISYLDSYDYSKCTVLPEKKNVKASFTNGVTKARITSLGDFSFIYNELPWHCVTLYVAKETPLVIPEGYEEVVLNPGDHLDDTLAFTNQNKVYHFTAGNYKIYNINLPSNSIMYSDRGTRFIVEEEEEGKSCPNALYSAGANVKVLGRSMFDFSHCCGGDAKHKGTVYFNRCENLYIEGMTFVNSNSWTLCVDACDKPEVCGMNFYGFRMYSDGIMMSDCTNADVHDNFIRTGDDACEMKSTSGATPTRNDNVFHDNTVWTDKGIAYGCIYEANANITGAIFRDNSVGFALSSWSEHLGCCVMQMGNNSKSTWSDVHFENIEVYKTSNALMSIYIKAANANQGGKIKDIYFKNITCKYTWKTGLPVYALSVVRRIGNFQYENQTVVGKLYIDNVSYKGVKLTDENLKASKNEYLNIAQDDDISSYAKSNIKVNTL